MIEITIPNRSSRRMDSNLSNILPLRQMGIFSTCIESQEQSQMLQSFYFSTELKIALSNGLSTLLNLLQPSNFLKLVMMSGWETIEETITQTNTSI